MFLWRAKVKFKKHDDFVKKSNIKRSAILLLWDIDMKKKKFYVLVTLPVLICLIFE